jgi:hypothetical protein
LGVILKSDIPVLSDSKKGLFLKKLAEPHGSPKVNEPDLTTSLNNKIVQLNISVSVS